jgi:4-carboxymuconolactone decarboxylase
MLSDPELHARGIEVRDLLFGGQRGEKMNLAMRAIFPDLETVAIDWAIGGIMGRSGMDLVKRELVIIAYCVACGGLEGVKAHAEAALRVGATPQEIFETIFQCLFYTGAGPLAPALAAFKEVMVSHDQRAESDER